MCDYIDKLKELTPNLPETPTLMDLRRASSDGVVEYEVESGSMVAINLYKNEIAISKTFMTNNTQLTKHYHKDSYEILIVLSGKIEIEFEGSKQVLQKFDKITIDSNKRHSAKAVEDTWLIAVTVPTDDGFPE